MEELYDILSEIRPDIDFETETALVDEGLLDSMDIASIMLAINENMGVEIDVKDLLPENFNSAEAIYNLILKLR